MRSKLEEYLSSVEDSNGRELALGCMLFAIACIALFIPEYLIFGFSEDARRDWPRMLYGAIIGPFMWWGALFALAVGTFTLHKVIREKRADLLPFTLALIYGGIRVPIYWIQKIVIQDVPAFGHHDETIYAVTTFGSMAHGLIWALEAYVVTLLVVQTYKKRAGIIAVLAMRSAARRQRKLRQFRREIPGTLFTECVRRAWSEQQLVNALQCLFHLRTWIDQAAISDWHTQRSLQLVGSTNHPVTGESTAHELATLLSAIFESTRRARSKPRISGITTIQFRASDYRDSRLEECRLKSATEVETEAAGRLLFAVGTEMLRSYDMSYVGGGGGAIELRTVYDIGHYCRLS